MKNNNKILDELLKELTGLPDNPTYDDVIEAANRVREENQAVKRMMVEIDKCFYDNLRKKDQF